MHLHVKRAVTTGALTAALLLGGVQGAAAQAAGGGGGQPAAPPIVALRKALMVSNQQHIAALRTLLSGEVNLPLHILKHTQALADNGMMLGQLFPEGSTHAMSRSKSEIWSDAGDFATKVRAFADATSKLNSIAQRGFNDQTLEALNAVTPTCGSCHAVFRGPAPQTD